MLLDEFSNAIVGASISDIERLDHTWSFSFDSGWTVATETYWRVLTRSGIVTSEIDDQQLFGHAQAVSAASLAREALSGKVSGCMIDPVSADLYVAFANGGALQFFKTSAGYEGWRASNTSARSIIAMGGGAVVEL